MDDNSDVNEFNIYKHFCSGRFSRIESKLDSIESKLDQRLTNLENFQAKALGIVLFLSVSVPIALDYFFKN